MSLSTREESYVTIDSPPRFEGDDDDKQGDFFNDKGEEGILAMLDGGPNERMWKISLQLTLTADDGKPTRVCLVAGMVRGSIVPELIDRAVASRRNKRIIEAVLDNPSKKDVSNAF